MLDRWEKVIPADWMLGEWGRMGCLRAVAGVLDYPRFKLLARISEHLGLAQDLAEVMSYCFLAGAAWMMDGKLPREFYSEGVEKAFRGMFGVPEE